MHVFVRLAGISALLITTGSCLAADKMKPGLWEMTMKSDAMKAMPKIPPEQLEKMKQMGIKMPDMQNGAMVHKVCFTKEMVDQDKPPSGGREQQCQNKNFSRSGNSYSSEIVCDMPEMKGTGNVKGSFTPDSLTSVYDFKGVSHGQPVSQHMETTGKWVGSDCGDVKPPVMPQKK
ncbi:DUF3617 domain-containing protein [Undibacterium sp. CY18W]|uniref:DUF3617 domain-containing protein n=1 Tax=Undibacterium hunanense TaxID=2762292 RepID=A0ABR6ZV87_9BURK|nr:DUF3617 domain-containing protein [Undibacterium hunanense]MBC3919804.1 DUF3617 domain-containing protein [Undibacterium hunanense]